MPNKHLALVVLIFMFPALVGAGCGQKTSVSTNGTPGTNPTPSTTTSDACGNPYYPFKPGLTIAYRVTPATGAGDSDYTLRVVSVVGTTATVRAEMSGGATADLSADCASGSVALKGSANLGAALEGVKFKTTVVSTEGTFMPANVSAGTTWSNSETVNMEVTGGAAAGMGPITTTTMETSKAVAEESVTVPAGTYRAIKVALTRTTTAKFSGAPAGVKLPDMPPTTSTSTEWWVKGIGMVKTVTVSEGRTSTIEAKSVMGQ